METNTMLNTSEIPEIRWLETLEQFLVTWGNVRMALSPKSARVLGAALMEAARSKGEY